MPLAAKQTISIHSSAYITIPKLNMEFCINCMKQTFILEEYPFDFMSKTWPYDYMTLGSLPLSAEMNRILNFGAVVRIPATWCPPIQ